MNVNKWTLGLAAVGLVSLPAVSHADEKASPVMTALSSTTISGYVSTSAQWDLGTGNANSPGFGYNYGKQDGFNLDVVKLTISKPLDEGQWSAGYTADLLFGPDANLLGTQSNTSFGSGDLAIKQAYVALRAPVGNGLDFKIGVFDTIIGYETFDAGNNPNYTRSYGYTFEPTTHTGILATYQFSEMFGAAVGIANTFGPQINDKAHLTNISGGNRAESYKTYMGSLAFTAPESFGFLKGSTLYVGAINGFNNNIAGGETQTSYYAGGTLATPITGVKLGASHDYVDVHNGGGYAHATALYLSFQATEKLSLHARGEYAQQSDFVVGGGQTTLFGTTSTATAAGGSIPSKVFAYTGTVQYDLWKNVMTRAEFRWDHAADGRDAFGGRTVTAAPDRKNHFMVLANVIYKF